MAEAEARLQAGSTLFETEHGAIEYATQGSGAAVLSIHGAGGGYDQGLWLARLAFGDKHRVVSVSRYGYLRTPTPPDASVRTQAALYRALLDHLDIQRVLVIGTSAGGPSATQFANDYPERTSALVLLSAVSLAAAPGDKPSYFTGIIHLIQRSDYAYWLMTRYLRPVILNLMGIPASVYASLSPAQKQLAQEMLATMHPMSRRYRGTVNDGRMLEREPVRADQITTPTLILHANDDALVSVEHARHAHHSIPGSRLVLFETGGHGLLTRTGAVREQIDTMKGS